MAPQTRAAPVWHHCHDPSPSCPPQGGVVYMFFSVSVEECVFLRPTHYGTTRWTPGGDIMMVQSHNNGESWTRPQVGQALNPKSLRLNILSLVLTPTVAECWVLDPANEG